MGLTNLGEVEGVEGHASYKEEGWEVEETHTHRDTQTF